MQNLDQQMSLFDTYNSVCESMDNDKPKIITLLEEHLDFENLIPSSFHYAFYRRFGRRREYSLVSFIKFFVLQKLLGITDKAMLIILNCSTELRAFCEFEKVPDASKITRFRQDFVKHIKLLFDNCVEITEPICRELDSKKADYLIYDPTGIEAYVAENNPKFLDSRLKQIKKQTKANPDINPYALAYSQMPEVSSTNHLAKQQYINGHFCYAFKLGVLTDGLGIVRDIVFFDEAFKRNHPETITKKTDNPELDKEISDSVSLKPVLTDFFKTHPTFSYSTFLGDSAFDSYDNYRMLRKEFLFERMVIPINSRKSSSTHKDFNGEGTPLCPIDKTPFTYIGVCDGKNRSRRFKYVCHMSVPVPKSSKRVCECETPCTKSTYGRCVYIYPDKDLRLYPGIARGTDHWANLYRHRVLVERSINTLKNTFMTGDRKSFSIRSAKSDMLFAGITQLVGVILAYAINKPEWYKSVRKLIA